MANPIALDPGTYNGTYKLIGGAPALDFANLMSYRGMEREHDWLDPASNLEAWAKAAGINGAITSSMSQFQALREQLYRVFLDIAERRVPADEDVSAIDHLARAARSARSLRFTDGQSEAIWTIREPFLLDEIALNASEILTSASVVSRIAACDDCRWVFLDTTRNRSRRWCDPADCGNRERQRRHYHRTTRSTI